MKVLNLIFSVCFLCLSPVLSANSDIPTKENLGSLVNSECDELNPIISPDGKSLYFCRTSCNDGIENEEIWVSQLNFNGNWSKAVNIGKPLNNKFNNFVCSVSPDGTSLLLGTTYFADTTKTPESGVSISHKTKAGWSFPENQIIKDFSNKSKYASYYLDNNGSILLMTIQRNDSYGEKDIYVSFKQQDGKWGTPKNLGPKINTADEELSPFIAADGVTLYFASEGHGGYGGSDIFVSKRLDDTWTNWSEPENLGPAINTEGWDAYYKISAKGDYAYLASTDNSLGKSDIFRIKIPENKKPEVVTLMKGKVTDYKTKAPVVADLVFETLPDGKQFASIKSAGEWGQYGITLRSGSKYSFRPFAKNYIGANEEVDLTSQQKFQESEVDIELIPAADSLICISNLFFETARATFNSSQNPELNRLIKFLKENPKTVVEITGHTDNVGTKEINIKLSDERAAAASNFLINNGISSIRMILKPFGFEIPVMNNDTERGRALNRRVEFKVFEK